MAALMCLVNKGISNMRIKRSFRVMVTKNDTDFHSKTTVSSIHTSTATQTLPSHPHARWACPPLYLVVLLMFLRLTHQWEEDDITY